VEDAALFSDVHPTHVKHKHGCWFSALFPPDNGWQMLQ